MVAILFICATLLSISSANGAQIDLSKLNSALEAMVQGFIPDDLTVALNLENIAQSSWAETLKNLIPDLEGTTLGLASVQAGLTSYVNALKTETANPTLKDIVIPAAAVQANLKSVGGMITAIQNIIGAQLSNILKRNLNTVQFQNGDLIVSIASTKVFQVVENIAQEFLDLGASTLQFHYALKELSGGISKYSQNNGVYKKASVAAQIAAEDFSQIGRIYQNVASTLKNAAQLQSNGDVLLSKDLLPSINAAANAVSIEFDLIANAMQGLLNEIAESVASNN